MSSRRFSRSDNERLASYNILGVQIEKHINLFKRLDADIMLRANNILNQSYELIRWYPIPLRNFQVSIKINFK